MLLGFFSFYLSFVLFFVQDMNSATHVHHSLQGAVIPSSGSVGMRIQYPFPHLWFNEELLLCIKYVHAFQQKKKKKI